MKTYLNADPNRELVENIISGEILAAPPINTPISLGHDIFFGDTLDLWTNPADPVGSALERDLDYSLEFQDSIATDQSGSVCYRQIVLLTSHAFVYAAYHAYGDLVSTEFVTDLSEIAETLEPRVTALETSSTEHAAVLFDHSERLTAVESLAEASVTPDELDEALSHLSTDDVPEGEDNQYWTQDRFDFAFSGKTTDDLPEGVENKYYPDAAAAELSNHEDRIFVLEGLVGGGDSGALSYLLDSLDNLGTSLADTPDHGDPTQLSEWVRKAAQAGFPIGAMMLFDANNPGPVVTSGNFVVGRHYTIKTVGTTNFTLIGAASNTVGVTFTATGVGAGSGDAYDIRYASGAWTDNVTMPGWYACVAGNVAFGAPDMTNRFMMGKVAAGAGATGGTNSYQIASGNLPTHTHAIDHDHPSVPSGGESAVHAHQTGIAMWRNGAGTSVAVYGETTSGMPGVSTDSVQNTHSSFVYTTFTSTDLSGHTHAVDLPNYTGSSGNGGFANTAVDNRPAYYSGIFIKKCA